MDILRKVSDPINDETCNFCDKNSVYVLQGSQNCHYCGNQINICEDHFKVLVDDVSAMEWEPHLEAVAKAHGSGKQL